MPKKVIGKILVVAKDAKIPIYTIKPEVGGGKEKRLHRNNIMSCNLILSKEKKVKKKMKIQTSKRTINNVKTLAESESDDEEIFVVEQKDIFENKGEEMVEEIKEIEEIDGNEQVEMIEDDMNEDPDNESNLEDHGEDEVELPNPRPQCSRKKPRILT